MESEVGFDDQVRPKRQRLRARLFVGLSLMAAVGIAIAWFMAPRPFESKRARAAKNVRRSFAVVEAYRSQHQNLLPDPATLRELLQLPPNEPLLDPWANEYRALRHPGSDIEIISDGDDGAPGGEGESADISSRGER